ncbi:MAG: AsmA family protein, partial [Sphingobium sp.]|nr:AsmA family protein [Sphingobium sp.]
MADAEPDAPKVRTIAAAGGTSRHIARARDRWRALPLPARIAIAIVGILLAIWLILFVTKGRFLKRPFEHVVGNSLNRQVRVDGDFQLYFAPITVKFLAEGMRISNASWASRPDIFRADRIDSRIAPLSLIFGDKVRVRWLELRNGAVDLEWSRDHQHNTWTFGDPTKKGKPLNLPLVSRALLTGTTLRFRDPRMQLGVDIRFETVKARDTQFASEVRFAGDGTMRALPFALKGGLLSPDQTVTGGRNQLAARMEAGATRVDVSGTLPGATQLEGSDLQMVAQGRNLARLFDFLGIVIPPTRTYRFTSDLTKAGEEWRFTHLKGRFGDSDLAGRFTVSQPGGRTLIKGDLATQKLDIIDVGPFIGYDPEKLASQGAGGAIETVSGTPRVLPDTPLRVEAIRNFDADVRYSVKTVRAPNVPISNAAVTVKLDRSLLTL